MKQQLKEYGEALENHLHALDNEMRNKYEVIRTRKVLLDAKHALQNREQELKEEHEHQHA